MQRFANRTVSITGAASSRGIGFATARRVAAGFRASGCGHDVADADAWPTAPDAADRALGPPHVPVNNAGTVVLKTIDAMDLCDWQSHIEVNLLGTWLGCRAFVARQRAAVRRGAIVNVSSMAGLVGLPRCTAYAAAKGGVRMLTKSLAMETAAEGTRVNSVHPGVIRTEIQNAAQSDGGAQSARIHAMIPMQRMGRPEEVAAMIAFLASDDAEYVTGCEFAVDGGMTAQ